MIRSEYMKWWREIGGVPSEAVTKKRTDLLVVGTERGYAKLEKAVKYGIPAIPYQTLALLQYDWKRQEPLVNLPAEIVKELNLMWMEMFDDVLAHHLTTDGLGGLLSFTQAVAAGVLRITRGAPVEGPCGTVIDPEPVDDPASYIRNYCRGAVVVSEMLHEAAALAAKTEGANDD